MNNSIIYLLGHYGVGKLTVAKAICAVTGARLFDNHLINNVVFSLIEADGKTTLPRGGLGCHERHPRDRLQGHPAAGTLAFQLCADQFAG